MFGLKTVEEALEEIVAGRSHGAFYRKNGIIEKGRMIINKLQEKVIKANCDGIKAVQVTLLTSIPVKYTCHLKAIFRNAS